jgi:hypothetical protein
VSAIGDFRPDLWLISPRSMVAESWLHPDQWYQTNVVANVRLHEIASSFYQEGVHARRRRFTAAATAT